MYELVVFSFYRCLDMTGDAVLTRHNRNAGLGHGGTSERSILLGSCSARSAGGMGESEREQQRKDKDHHNAHKYLKRQSDLDIVHEGILSG